MLRNPGQIGPGNVSRFAQEKYNFFPVLESAAIAPEQPTSIGPILDPEKIDEPLAGYSETTHSNVFGPHTSLDSETSIPALPQGFNDRYLYPSLCKNEHMRLTMLWYFTRGLQEDAELLQKLSQILEMVKQFLGGWEIGIIGIVEAETFSRIVTTNMSLAMIPRRESPCSHTINQHPGTVFTVRDMLEDWRFKFSPPAEYGGLRSYAGTQVLLTRHDGETVNFGSLCLASRSVQAPLDDSQKRSLIRAANMISGELVSRCRLRRLKERQVMMDVLNRLRSDVHKGNIEASTIEALAQQYPDSEVSIVHLRNNEFDLPSAIKVTLESVEGGLWEDDAFVKSKIEAARCSYEPCDRPVRAVIGQITPNDQLLIVSTYNLRYIFDDLDVWFTEQAASIIHDVQQARYLKEALAAKERFLSSIRHELRTPIHGILSSVELLGDELRARNLLTGVTSQQEAPLDSFLKTIRSSGTELMTTVNNILRLNAISGHGLNTSAVDSVYDLRCIEADLLDETLGNYSEEALMGLSIRFESSLAGSTVVGIDWEMVKEILKALLFNSIAATQVGSIIITTTLTTTDNLLTFDVTDTGLGIAERDHDRIFVAFEKLQEYSRGAGLGLSLASLMASALKGKLNLVSSQEGVGSHFRLEIPYVEVDTAARPTMPVRHATRKTRHIPHTFHIMKGPSKNLHLLSHMEGYLKSCGLEKSDVAEGSLIILSEPNPLTGYDDCPIHLLENPHRVFIVKSAPTDDRLRACLLDALKPHHISILTGPFFTARLDDILAEADEAIAKHERPDPTPQPLIHSPDAQPRSNSNASTDTNSCEATPPPTPIVELERLVISTPAPPTPKPIKVLLVDDNNVNLSVLQFFCKKRKFEFGSAVNGNQAVDLFRSMIKRQTFTLILMDLQMPECDGISATKQIRALEQQKCLPRSIIFMITGQDSVADRKASFEAGVDEFFCKPVSMKRLSQAISQWFPEAPVS